jgi:molybdopterin synthase catalytic subunit
LIEEWIREIKQTSDPAMLGMILTHNGVVRGSDKEGKPVRAMRLSCDRDRLQATVADFKKRAGIVDIKVWINEGDLQIGDDIMKVCIAGRFRTDVTPVFQELIALIKKEIVTEKEI